MDNAIPRTLLRNGEQVPQTQLRNGKGLIVLLAEPGAGKTRVMRSEADADGGILLSGSQVMHRSSLQCGATLYVDGLDEVARSGDDAIDAVLYKLAETKPSKLVLACRATQWEQRHDRTLATEFECFESPQKLHLRPLDRKEQIQLVERRYDGFELVQFFDLADRLQLTDALSNPQMLIVFADAFVMKSGSDFTRTSAYEASIAGALQEQNGVKKDKTIDYQMLHETAGSMAARMLLVGASGVNLDPVEASTDLPSVHSFDEAPDHILAVTSTKLFQPLGASDCFGFVHRTFAEYLGGQYLAKRVADSEDKLSLNRVLTWIAPEKVLRPELSGLLAWLAAHGRPEDQIAAMELNAYAVLANGDPTALRGSARRALLEALAAQAAENPYFRAEDGWRTIFADSYFDEAEAEALKSIFEDSQTPESLIDLLLDLLGDGVAATGLSPMILKMALDKDRSRYSRRKPVLTLAKLGNEDYETLVASLIEEQSDHALYLLFVAFDQRQRVDVEGDVLRDYFLQWARIIPFGVYYSEKKNWGITHFPKHLLRLLPDDALRPLLDGLTNQLKCDCKIYDFGCRCRHSLSVLIAWILNEWIDRDLPLEANRLWCWMKDLRFQNGTSPDGNPAVRWLWGRDHLRREMQWRFLSAEYDEPDLHMVWVLLRDGRFHAGVSLQHGDHLHLMERAAEEGYPQLWISLVPSPSKRQDISRLTSLRRRARELSKNSDLLLAEWFREKKSFVARSKRFSNRRWKRRNSRYDDQRNAYEQIWRAHFQENRNDILQGRYLGWLDRVANETSDFPNHEYFSPNEAQQMMSNALKWRFLDAPGLIKPEIADVVGKTSYSWHRTLKQCIAAHLNVHGNFNGVDEKLLLAAWAQCSASDGKLMEFLEKHLFYDQASFEAAATQIFEGQKTDEGRELFNLDPVLETREFQDAAYSLALAWIQLDPSMGLFTLSQLFDFLANDLSNWPSLIRIATEKTDLHLPEDSTDPEFKTKTQLENRFWLVRLFFLEDQTSALTRDWLNDHRDSLLEIEKKASRLNIHGSPNWVTLNLEKTILLLSLNITRWPPLELPDSYGSRSPDGEKAYRFMCDLVWSLHSYVGDDAIGAIDSFLANESFTPHRSALLSARSSVIQATKMASYKPPTMESLSKALESSGFTSVEELKTIVLETLDSLQAELSGGLSPRHVYFNIFEKSNAHKTEDEISEIVARELSTRLSPLGLEIDVEKLMSDRKRCDITIRFTEGSASKLLVIEAKGQWHRELFEAAETQLEAKYMIHPVADNQGIYLAYWVGCDTAIAGKNGSETTASELKTSIEKSFSHHLLSKVDVYVLDLSLE